MGVIKREGGYFAESYSFNCAKDEKVEHRKREEGSNAALLVIRREEAPTLPCGLMPLLKPIGCCRPGAGSVLERFHLI